MEGSCQRDLIIIELVCKFWLTKKFVPLNVSLILIQLLLVLICVLPKDRHLWILTLFEPFLMSNLLLYLIYLARLCGLTRSPLVGHFKIPGYLDDGLRSKLWLDCCATLNNDYFLILHDILTSKLDVAFVPGKLGSQRWLFYLGGVCFFCISILFLCTRALPTFYKFFLP